MKPVVLFDELGEYDLDNLNRNRPLDVSIEQLIYAYHNGGYDGSGVAVYLDNKGQWHLDEISHCSCNGALDEGFNKIGYTKDQLIELLKKRADEHWRPEDYKLVVAELEKLA